MASLAVQSHTRNQIALVPQNPRIQGKNTPVSPLTTPTVSHAVNRCHIFSATPEWPVPPEKYRTSDTCSSGRWDWLCRHRRCHGADSRESGPKSSRHSGRRCRWRRLCRCRLRLPRVDLIDYADALFDVQSHRFPQVRGIERSPPLPRRKPVHLSRTRLLPRQQFFRQVIIVACGLREKQRQPINLSIIESGIILLCDQPQKLLSRRGGRRRRLRHRRKFHRCPAMGANAFLARPIGANFQNLQAMRAGKAIDRGSSGIVGHVPAFRRRG